MSHREVLHTAAQVGAGLLVAFLFVTVGAVLVLDLQEEPCAWGVALVITGLAFGVGFGCVLWADRSPRSGRP